jgi:choline-sulfatase
MTNVVLVSIDCLRADRVYDYHRFTTPTLCELKSNSYIYNHAYATGPYTSESVPGLLAGYHSYNGTYFGEDTAWKAIPCRPTLASWLKKSGYKTIATVTNPHLTQSRNFDIGFDHFENLRIAEGQDGKGETSDDNGGFSLRLGSLFYNIRDHMQQYDTPVNPYTLPMIAYRYSQTVAGWPTVVANSVVDEFQEQIQNQDTDFFSWVHFMDLHVPLRPQSVKEGGLSSARNVFSQLKSDATRAANIYTAEYSSMYDSVLKYVDTQINRIIQHLQSINVWDETVFIVTGDHGEVLYDRNQIYGHPRHHFYDELLNVPLIVRTPDKRSGIIDTPISLAWVSELIADACNLEPPDFPSKSGRNNLYENSKLENPVISDTVDSKGHTIAIRDDCQKIIHHEPTETRKIPYQYSNQDVQFNFRNDPRERIPMPPSAKNLENQIEELSISPDELPSLAGQFTETAEKRLQDLGYKM